MEFQGTKGEWKIEKRTTDPETYWIVTDASYQVLPVCMVLKDKSMVNAKLIKNAPKLAENILQHIDAIKLNNVEFYEKYGFGIKELEHRSWMLLIDSMM